jgi:hypothetical protein
MTYLEQTPTQIANKMRQVAVGVLDPAQAEAIRRYTSWLEADFVSVQVPEVSAAPRQRSV